MLPLWLVLQFAVILAVETAAAQLVGVPRDPRLEKLQEWITAVEGHRPGTISDVARTVRLWDRSTLANIRDDLHAVTAFIRDPSVVVVLYDPFRNPDRGRPDARGRGYTANQARGLRIIASETARRNNINNILKRGALLHTDIALMLPAQGGPVTSTSTPAMQRTTLYLDDGRQQGLDQSVGHLEMARRLLDLIRPNPQDDKPYPERDATVRAWYQATTAVLVHRATLDLDHFKRALELFPDDAEVLFMAGALRETLAAPRIQDGVRTARLPSGLSYDVDSERDELRRAENLFRRSLTADPSRVETHVRLGRVLGLLGRPAEAVNELRAAAAVAREPLLAYYAELFLGREADAVGDPLQARVSYERAATLYPLAQSPRMALSELAMRNGERSNASLAIEPVWRLPAKGDEREDPLWSYHYAAGRGGDARMAALEAQFSLARGETQ